MSEHMQGAMMMVAGAILGGFAVLGGLLLLNVLVFASQCWL